MENKKAQMKAALRRSREVAESVDRLIRDEVRVARRLGLSWTEIGKELGTSHVTAAARWRRDEEEEEEEQMATASTDSWDLSPGDEVVRSELHDRFGGNRQRGIVTTATQILLFSEGGEQHGYTDGPDASGKFYLYTGEGQNGDQTLSRGNKAIVEHAERDRPLRLFEGARGTVKYLGQYELHDYEWVDAPQTGSPGLRSVIQFRLRPAIS